jgi:hypothetical protein
MNFCKVHTPSKSESTQFQKDSSIFKPTALVCDMQFCVERTTRENSTRVRESRIQKCLEPTILVGVCVYLLGIAVFIRTATVHSIVVEETISD